MTFINRILLLALIQTAFLFFMIGNKEYTLLFGTPVILETAPIDPRSLFSGDYVSLNYKISELILDQLLGDKSFQFNDTVYVTLVPGEPYWNATGIYKTKPEVKTNEVILKGRAIAYLPKQEDPRLFQPREHTTLRIWYGIEQYYIPEGEGKKIENWVGKQQMKVKVTVDRFGRAAIKALLLDDQEVYKETLF